MRPRLAVLLGVVALAVLLALSAVVEFPGERALKERLGLDYGVPACEKVAAGGPVGHWRPETSLPSLRDEPRAVRVGGGAFLAGGIASLDGGVSRSVTTFERYDFATRRYTSLPSLPLRLNHLGIAAVGDDVYVIGGLGEERAGIVATNRAFRFRAQAHRWEELARMRYPRGAHGVAVVRGRIFVIGGRRYPLSPGSRPEVAMVESFDTRSERWKTHGPMPLARDHLGVAAHRGQIYVFGGRVGNGTALARLDRFDPDTGRWVRLRNAPLSTSGISLLDTGGLLVFAGGELPREGRILEGMWGYQVDIGRWKQLPALPSPRHGYASAFAEGRIYLFGGSTCPGFKPTTGSSSLGVLSP